MNDANLITPFEGSMSFPPRLDRFWIGVLGAALLTFVAGAALVLLERHWGPVVSDWLWREARAHPWIARAERPSLLWAAMGSCLYVFRTALWFAYRPAPPVTAEEAPFLTVIVPAYNEGPMVARTIDSIVAADYPRDRLEVIAVDDGSGDDTWTYIEEAAARHPELVKARRFPKNQGKRAALEAGFREGRGSLFVTVDSDSVIEPHTLLSIAGPFRDPKVGAVAGKVLVHNRRESLLPRMLHVRFILSFDFLRAVQSTYGIVYCCPGALSAYRRSVVERVLDAWTNQTFLGSRCTYGEDRAMTNFILGEGYRSVYQSTAVVHTIVPTTYGKMCKMFLRWDRSYIREELRYVRILHRQPLVGALISGVDLFLTNLRYPISWTALAMLVFLTIHHPLVLARTLASIGVFSALNTVYFLRSERSWSFLYGVAFAYFSFFTMMWIFPYALLTVRSRSWMTR